MTGAVLGFDVGHKRIGVAVGNAITGTASELGLIEVRDGIPDWARFEALLKDWAPTQLVVGDPLTFDDADPDPPARQRARGFARAAAKRSGLGPLFQPTGDVEADMAAIKAFYAPFKGRNADQFESAA